VHYLAGDNDKALEAAKKAVDLDANLAAAYLCYAGIFADQGQIPEGLACYSMALALSQDHPEALAGYQRLSRAACEWDGLPGIEDKIHSSTYRKGIAILPSPLLNMDCSAEEHLIGAREWARRIASPLAEPLSGSGALHSGEAGRIRLGYIYGDLDEFDASAHIGSVIASHDRDRFEVFGFCYGVEGATGLRQRLDAACDSDVNIGHLSHAAAAREIHGAGIDILIDLEGYAPHARPAILSCRPAPVQVNYLGFPASMGAAFTDYIIADRVTVPMDQQPFFDEKIVQLPGCYLPAVPEFVPPSPDAIPSRADCGLPETGVILCCFNAHAKITSSCFAIWMRILRDVPGSVLWLAQPRPVTAKNIRLNAAALGIDPARLIFAPECSHEEHIARLGNADLFLDTMPSSSPAAVNDALAAGVPVLGCAGETFVSRITASQLRSCNLSDFVTYAPDHYEQVACRLARDRKHLAGQRDRVAECLQHTGLFDSAAYSRNLEAAFERMVAQYRKGKAPEAFTVSQMRTAERAADAQTTESDEDLLLLEEIAEEDETAAMLGRIPYKACPICASEAFVPFKSTDASQHPCYTPAISSTISWQHCSDCDHVFTAGYFSRESNRLIRAQVLPDQEAGSCSEAERTNSIRIVSTVTKLMPSGEWLDVGCGNAAILIAASEAGYKTFGVGYREANAERLRQLGHESWPCSLEELDIEERFSAISLNDHLFRAAQPIAALNAAHRMLKPGGVIICSFANKAAASWLFGDQSGKDPYWSDLNYFHSFTRERFDTLLAQQSFEPEFHDENDKQSAVTSVIAVRIETGPPEDQ
jgi:SAM-dependent methyltransferase